MQNRITDGIVKALFKRTIRSDNMRPTVHPINPMKSGRNNNFKRISLFVFAFTAWMSVPAFAQTEYDREALYDQLDEEANLLDRQYGLLKKVVRVIQPSVVHIQAVKEEHNSNRKQLASVEEAGAGIIFEYEDRFYVITNRHVIADTDLRSSRVALTSGKFIEKRRDRTATFAVNIRLDDGRFFSPTEIRMDRGTDLAVMYLDEKDVVAARFGDSSKVEIGEFVVAVGSPFGLSHSVSYGVVSAQGRRDLELGSEGVVFQDFIQTDAAINPGNSGGPLLNLRGEVIGINTAIASNSGGSDGIGFTVPSNMVKRIATHLIDHGYVRRGFMGVTLEQNYTQETAASLGLNTVFGARVRNVNPNSPASEVDIENGDVILKFNGRVIENDSHLVNAVSMTDIGDTIPVELYRSGSRKTVYVTIRERGR